MKETIWKFQLLIQDKQIIKMPKNAQILSVQMQGDVACLWAIVSPSNPVEDRIITVHGTGHPLPPLHLQERKYIGTFQLERAVLVFHVFELVNFVGE